MRGLRRFIRPPGLLGRTAIAGVLVMLGLAYGYAARRGDTAQQRLVRVLLADRFTTGRLTGQTAWQPCIARDTAVLVPRMHCGLPPDQERRRLHRVSELVSAVRAIPQADSSVATLRGEALLDLRSADSATVPVERAAAALEEAHRLAPGDAGVLNELAVAYLAVGERTQELTPMLRALDAVERAAAQDSLRPEILFNRALILQRLYLIASAGRAWARYLSVERDPAWRREAEAHARWVAQVPDTVAWDGMLASPPVRMDATARAQIAARVRRSPQKAREFGFPLLGGWGEAVQAGDSVRAARLLAVAREIGKAEQDLNVDPGVSLYVDAIGAAGPVDRSLLVDGHALLQAGLDLYGQGEYDSAVSVLSHSADRLRRGGSRAAGWAAFYRAASEINRVNYASGDAILRDLVSGARPDEPALSGKASWAMGLSQLRRGNYDEANRLYQQAVPYITKAADAENSGALAHLLAEGLALAGRAGPGAEQAFRALRRLCPFRSSTYLSNHVTAAAGYARSQGLSHAALALTNELVEVAQGIGRPRLLALAHAARMRDHDAVGRRDNAMADLNAARQWADSIGGGKGGSRLRAHVWLALGQFTRRHDPGAALPLLAEAVSIYSGFRNEVNLPTALYEAALAARATGDPRAGNWLEQAVEHVERQRTTFSSTESRASFYETVENIFDAAIEIELDEGRHERGFEMLERGRIHAFPDRAMPQEPAVIRAAPLRPTQIAAALPDSMLLIEYAVLRDRVAIWAVSRKGTWHHSVAIARDSLAALVEEFRSSEITQGRADQLYDMLLRPLAAQLNGIRELTVVPDRELYLIPFAALRDRTTGQFVVERFRTRTLPSAHFFITASRHRLEITPASTALVVGNPALDRTVSDLRPLPGSSREARAVAALYGGGTLLQEDDAHRGQVLSLLPNHSIVHFAGHAVFNADQPELSYLALAPDSVGDDGRLQAREIGRLRLSNLQVVVLSACSSLSPRASRTGAVAGLAYSFLQAGAPATVSTLWDVEDGATTGLLVQLHHYLAAGTPAAEALRLAQVDALRSSRPELRALRTWAGFIYTGP